MEPPVRNGAGRQGTVVVCDDTESIRRLLAMILELEGFNVLEASDGVQAIRLLQEGALPPSVVIVDAQMSPGDGWSVLEVMRVNERLRDVPVLMASAEPTCQDGARERAVALGLDACLAKPFEPDRVLELVRGFARYGRGFQVPDHLDIHRRPRHT
ncbi:MAG: response regulator [Dermatophilaceae bacterium]